MNWFLDVLRGAVIGLANVIPGVSGGTMMVSMGIYDKLIYCINHLFRSGNSRSASKSSCLTWWAWWARLSSAPSR